MNNNYLIHLNPFEIFKLSPQSSIKEARAKFIRILGICSEKYKPFFCLAFDMICNKSSYLVVNGDYWVKKEMNIFV